MARKKCIYVQYCAKDFLDGCNQLDPMEELVYRRICDLIYATQNKLIDNDKKLAWMTKAGRRWGKIKETLVEMGKIAIEDGRIVNRRCTIEITKATEVIAQKSGAASKRWSEANALKENKTSDAGAYANQESGIKNQERTNPSVPESEPVAVRDHLKVVHDADRDRPAEDAQSPPLPPRSARNRDGEEYKFGGRFIRLNAADFDRWAKLFSAIPDFAAYLEGLDSGYFVEHPEKRKGWYTAIAPMAAKRNQDILTARQQEDREREEGKRQPFTFGIG